jgi:DNA primase
MLTEELKAWDITTPEGSSSFLSQARKILELVPDKIQYSSYLRKLATWTGIPHSEITSLLRQKQQYQNTPQEPALAAPTEEPDGLEAVETPFLAAILQHPTEAGTVLDKFNITTSYFKSDPTIITTILSNIYKEDYELDMNDTRIIKLFHSNAGIVAGRTVEGIESLLKGLLKYRYSKDVASLNNQNLDFTELLFKQEELKKYYKQ